MNTKKANTKIISVQIELDLDAPTSQSRGGVPVWRGEATLEDGFRLFFQIYSPKAEKPQAKGLKVVAK